jgi:hypothetical protein
VLLAERNVAVAERLGLEPAGGGQIGVFVVLMFVVGVVMVWLYAAMRPRFGPGARTAVLAGLVVWFLSRLIPSVIYSVSGVIPPDVMYLAVGWSLAEVLAAALVGGWYHRET